MELKFVLKVTNDPVVEELEFDTIEALQAKVAELTPPAPEPEEKPEETPAE